MKHEGTAVKDAATLDVAGIRAQFPILHQQVNGRPLVYLDNGATGQKPYQVIDAIANYYATINSNVHRGIHTLSNLATEAQERTRSVVRKHLNARYDHEVIFTSGTTASINMVADSLGHLLLEEGDEVLISELEHHANIVPWQLACARRGALLKVIPVTNEGELQIRRSDDQMISQLTERAKILAISHVSNTLGTINPVKELIAEAKRRGVITVLDGAQAVPHMHIDVQDLDCDFYAFSAHKMYGPTGVGILYGREEMLERMPPWQGGGEMIDQVTFEETTWAKLPFKFEAGTPNIAGIIGLRAAIDWMNATGIDRMAAHEQRLLEKATTELLEIDGLRIIGTAKKKGPLISFVIEGAHHYDIGTILDQLGIAVRTGHHCTQPLMRRYGVTGTTRASFACFNTMEEVDALVAGVKKAVKMLR